MLPSRRVARERKLLLAVVAVASGVTISCSEPGGIGVYPNPAWDAAFEDAAKDASPGFGDAANDAANDAPDDSPVDASDAASDASAD